MMSNPSRTSRPLLTRYEIEIPEEEPNHGVYYDECRMILMKNGMPVAKSGQAYHPGGTKITFVGQETRDDN